MGEQLLHHLADPYLGSRHDYLGRTPNPAPAKPTGPQSAVEALDGSLARGKGPAQPRAALFLLRIQLVDVELLDLPLVVLDL